MTSLTISQGKLIDDDIKSNKDGKPCFSAKEI